MKIHLSKFLIIVVVLFTACILFTSTAMAAGPYEPYLDYSGQFSYTDSSNTLTFANTAFSAVTYLDGSSETYSGSPLDPILGASIYVGDLFNTAANSTHFDNGSGGGVTFEIKDDDYTYLSATLTSMDFSLIGGGFIPTALSNIPLDIFNLIDVSFGSGFTSQYITELINIGTPDMQFSSTFTFNSGDPVPPSYDFKGGNSAGTMTGIVSAPEPVSSALFVIGGLTFAFRRVVRKNRITS